MTTIQKTYRIDSEVQQQADKYLEAMGLTTSAAINMLLKKIVEDGKFPFVPEVSKEKRLEIAQKDIDAIVSQKYTSATHVSIEDKESMERFFSE